MDDLEQCQATFNCTLCGNSTLIGTEGCQTSNKYCRPTRCPNYFYFEVNRTGSGFQDNSSNNFYVYFTQNSTVNTSLNGYDLVSGRTVNTTLKSPQGANISYYYRMDTNFCKLCDYRCMKCFGPTNGNCTQCVNHYYLWTTATVCSSTCPTGQFQLNISASYPDNETKCGNCNTNCIACVGYSSNCTSCQQFPNSNYGFLFTYQSFNSTCLPSCPTSSSPLTAKGYYGSINSMKCYPCPNQCSNCNIGLTMNTTAFP